MKHPTVARFDAARATHTRADVRALEVARNRARTVEDLRAINDVEYRLDQAGKVADLLPAHLRADTAQSDGCLLAGERIIDANTACGDCDTGSCSCRRLPSSGRSDAHDGARHGRSDAGVLVPPAPSNSAALMFGEIDLTKARARIGEDRLRELKTIDEAKWKAAEATARTGSSAGCYRGVLVATIGAAYPDLAERAATESMTWLRAQYAALPNPNADTEPTQENTDMAQDDQDDFDPFAARRADAMAFARFDSSSGSGATSMTAAEQQAEVDKAERRFDAQIAREVYLRVARTLRGHDPQSIRTDAAGGKPKRTALQRAMGRLQAIYDAADTGTLDRKQAQEAAKILDSIAELHDQAGKPDEEENTERSDAAGNLDGRRWEPPPADAADELARRRERFLLTNAWNMTAEERRKVMNDWALADFNKNNGPDAA